MADNIRILNENYVEDLKTGALLPTRRTRRNIVIATLLFCWTVIGWVVMNGSPDNSLHQSALAWSYATFIGVIFAYVFGAVLDNWNIIKLGLANFIVEKPPAKP
jgi:ABC-type antimicrobial peptide transport system permease subunit